MSKQTLMEIGRPSLFEEDYLPQMDQALVQQRIAGTTGRQEGHRYENNIAAAISAEETPYRLMNIDLDFSHNHVFKGKPSQLLLDKILSHLTVESFDRITAYGTGRLATAESGTKELTIDGKEVKSTKSDVVLDLQDNQKKRYVIGVSVKQCNNRTPTNAQLFFTTASAFYELLINNFEGLTEKALLALRQFCGDAGFRPMDHEDVSSRISTPERYFWEEVDEQGRRELEQLFSEKQDDITRLLLQKGYKNDPFPPAFIFHKTKKTCDGVPEVAIYSVDEFIALSHTYSGFQNSTYRVRKGRYKEPESIHHLAPKFGVVQMQRGGQKQHPTQLQFNLKAGYFYDLEAIKCSNK